MIKNYKKIYDKLIKCIKDELKDTKKFKKELKKFKKGLEENIKRESLLYQIESGYAISILEYFLELSKELEGKEWNNLVMNEQEFLDWKKEISI